MQNETNFIVPILQNKIVKNDLKKFFKYKI